MGKRPSALAMERNMKRILPSVAAILSFAAALTPGGPDDKPVKQGPVCLHTIRGRSRRNGQRVEKCVSCRAQRIDGGPWVKPVTDKALELPA
jgi:hypothetical protein